MEVLRKLELGVLNIKDISKLEELRHLEELEFRFSHNLETNYHYSQADCDRIISSLPDTKVDCKMSL